MDLNNIKKVAEQVGLGKRCAQLLKVARPCILLKTKIATKNLPVGLSRFGGLPDLAPNDEWPEWNDRPLSFIGQLDLSELGLLPTASPLPTSGLLSFFYDSEQSTWGFDPKDAGSFRVLYLPPGSLRRADAPRALPPSSLFQPCRITFKEDWTLPSVESTAFEQLGFSKDERERYYDLLETLSNEATEVRRSFVFGHPDQMQGDMQEECALVTKGVYCGDASGYEDPRRPALAREAPNWRLLLQVASEDPAQMMWGDDGCLYYWIREDDLRKRRFNKTWMILQCG